MQLKIRWYILLAITYVIVSCQSKQVHQKNEIFSYVLPQASYFIKVNKKKVLKLPAPIIIDKYLSETDKNFLFQMPFDYPIGVNILQNNSKIKGFIATGNLSVADTLFDATTIIYEGDTIHNVIYQKQHFFFTKQKEMFFVSNNRLLIENLLRQKEEIGELSQSPTFQKGVKTLDNSADANIIVNLNVLKPDAFFESSFKIKLNNKDVWQFYDWVDVNNYVATGVTLANQNNDNFSSLFEDVKPSLIKQNFSKFIPASVGEYIYIGFDDFQVFFNSLQKIKDISFGKNNLEETGLESLQSIVFFKENNNKAVILNLQDTDDLIEEHAIKISEVHFFDIYESENKNLIDNYFNGLFPSVKSNFFAVSGSFVIIAETRSYLNKVLNDLQNKFVLETNPDYKNIFAELPENNHLILFKNKIPIKGKKHLIITSYSIDNEVVLNNLILSKTSDKKDKIFVEQVLSYPFKEIPHTEPQLVYNHKTKEYNIIYQDEENHLILLNFNGKQMWKIPLKGKIIGKIEQIDILRNNKLQYTFVTPHYWYVIDRLGRDVENFPQYFLQEITQGISVFDYERNRKYRFGITQSKKFRLFDKEAKRIKGFKAKINSDIVYSPKHFRIGNKDFIVLQDEEGKLYLLNRRGNVRIKINQNFKTFRNRWGVYHQKFVNIDDEDYLISINLSGKIKKEHLQFGTEILSEIKESVLSAVSKNKLLINNELKELDLGTYTRPKIFKTRKHKFVFIADEDNNKIYAFDDKGNNLEKFPIVGQKLLDFKSNKKGNYLLTYDSFHNLVVYKF